MLLSGCCPGRTALSPSVSDSLQVEREVRYVEKLRDTVIYVEVPVESRMVRVAADSSFLETSLATSSARVAADGTLSHTLENKPQRQPVGVTVRDTFERESELSGSVRTERVEVPVKVPLSWFQKSLREGSAGVPCTGGAFVRPCLRSYGAVGRLRLCLSMLLIYLC